MAQTSAGPRRVNLIFQGGGVRGIAYAGVLESMPSNVHINAVGGTSAGAIVAALLAVGRRPAELASLLDRNRFADFLEKGDQDRHARLSAMIRDARKLWMEAREGGKGIGFWAAWRHVRRHGDTLFKDLPELMRTRGLYRSSRIRGWLDELFGEQQIGSVPVVDLKIVAADTAQRRYRVFAKRTHGSTRIAEAVHQSISIPMFFWPYPDGNSAIVDGGLLSNYPAYLFAQSHYPTIGFRLRDVEVRELDQDFETYLRSLLLTMVEAHDAERPLPTYFKQYDIPASSVSSTKFNLDEKDQETLLLAGRAIGANVKWQDDSSPVPVIDYYDAKPQEALRDSMTEARKLFEISQDAADRAEELHQKTVYTVFVEADWSTRYELENTFQVKGRRPLIINRTRVSLLPAQSSIVDCDYTHVEIRNGKEEPLVRIPCENSEDVKAFLTFFWPPLAEERPSRTFRMKWSQPKEFELTLGNFRPGTQPYGDIAYATRQKGDRHFLELRFRVLVDNSLPRDLVLTSNTNELKIAENVSSLVAGQSNRAYREYIGSIGQMEVRDKVRFGVRLSRGP